MIYLCYTKGNKMLKISNLISDESIINDYADRKGYQEFLTIQEPSTEKDKEGNIVENFIPKEIENPESRIDYFDRIITQHITHVVQDFRDKNVAKEHKAEKVEL